MKRRIADGQIKELARQDHAFENMLALGLQLTGKSASQYCVAIENMLGIFQCGWVDIRADKAPAIGHTANHRVNRIGAHADIEHAHRIALRNPPAIGTTQKVGHIVQIIRPSWNRRAEIAFGDIPVGDAVKMREQGAVEHLHRRRIGKVDRVIAPGILGDKGRQRRESGNQCREIVAAAMGITRMQAVFNGRERFFQCHDQSAYLEWTAP